jgi:hypothetical protein
MDVVTDSPTTTDPHVRLARTAGVIGLVFVVLLFASVIGLSTHDEPPLHTTAREAARYLAESDTTFTQLAYAAATLGFVAGAWFFVAFGFVLARVEGAPAWRSALAAASGVLLTVFGTVDTSAQAGTLQGDRISEDVADFAFHVNSLGFANMLVGLGSFAVVTGWVLLTSGVQERWLGWWIGAAGVGLVLVRFAWTTWVWVLPYIPFWVWVVTVSIRLVRRRDAWVRPAG